VLLDANANAARQAFDVGHNGSSPFAVNH